MKLFINGLTIATLMAVSFTVSAEWRFVERSGEYWATSYINESSSAERAYTDSYAVYENGKVLFRFVPGGNATENPYCLKGMPKEAVVRINGEVVKFSIYGQTGPFCTYYTSTKAGQRYLRKEFEKKNFVLFDDLNFSAIGFRAAVAEVDRFKSMKK